MIALDTNALVRLLTEDDPEQAKTVQEIILHVITTTLLGEA